MSLMHHVFRCKSIRPNHRKGVAYALVNRLASTKPDYTNYETWHIHNYENSENCNNPGKSSNLNTNINRFVDKRITENIISSSFRSNSEFSLQNNAVIEGPRTSVLMELSDEVGALHDVLKYYWKYDVNITRIESRPVSTSGENKAKFDFFVDFDGKVGDFNVNALLNTLKGMTDKLLVLDEKEVHWFPRHISELDLIANRILDAGVDLEADHPGFHDVEYRQRRAKLAQLAIDHRMGDEIPTLNYNQDEIETWKRVWDTMEDLWEKYACKEYKVRIIKYLLVHFLRWMHIHICHFSTATTQSFLFRREHFRRNLHNQKSMHLMKKHCSYSRTTIPQLSSISSFLQLQTNFRLRPVAGLISSRDFLNGLAFRTFFCTQYIRHRSKPLYTPEPDICHELLGHVPMFADRDFCDFSQEIGLASLGASDDDINKLARCYWHSVEFGLCREDGKNKAYGAGLLSSFGELEYACGEREDNDEKNDRKTEKNHEEAFPEDQHTIPARPEIKPWDPAVASMQDFPITTYQPVYFLAESLQDAKLKMRKYCEELPRPFFALYNAQTESVHIDRPVRRAVGIPSD